MEDSIICGHVGVAGKIDFKTEKMFKTMLELDVIRGPHSTGVAFVSVTGRTEVVKKVGTPWEGLYDSKAFESEWKMTHNVLMGHNRWATKGKVNARNAHPFEFDNIIGAHNGTLKNHSNLDNGALFEVDSEAIFHHMDIHGVPDTISKLNGAFALVWWNKEENTINFCRNDERSFYYAFSEDRKTLVWASEAWIIEIAARYSEIKMGEIYPLAIGVHFRFDIPLGQTYDYKPLEKCTTRKMEMFSFQKPAITVVAGTGSTNSTSKQIVNANKQEQSNMGKQKASVSSSEYIKRVSKFTEVYVDKAAVNGAGQPFIQCWDVDNDEVSIRIHAVKDSELWKELMESSNFFRVFCKSYSASEGGYLSVDLRTITQIVSDSEEDDIPFTIIKGHDGTPISSVVFAQRTDKGCAWCSCNVDEDEADNIVWIAKDDFICGDCKHMPDVKQYLAKVG